MYDTFLVQVSDSHCKLNSVELCSLLRKFTFYHVCEKISTSDKRHYEVDSLVVLEVSYQTNMELMVSLQHNILFQLGLIYL